MKDINKFKGCLIGGAIGDALGYPVEFLKLSEIKEKYGNNGITKYDLVNNIAPISDDTQMTLFTAEGLIFAYTRGNLRGILGPLEHYIHAFYIRWLNSQSINSNFELYKQYPRSWLLTIKEINNKRAPGNTCLSALSSDAMGTIEKPINNSKGCGSVMRVAPVGLYIKNEKTAFDLGKKVGAITHGHPLGYLSSGILALIINKIVYGRKENLEEIITESIKYLENDTNSSELKIIIKKSIELSHQNISDEQAIKQLGEGWIAEEALAIAIYSSLKYSDNFEKGIICAVNHDGDSDSTGAITGNILGAYLGLDVIPKKYLNNLELKDIILEIASDLYSDIPVSENSNNETKIAKEWIKKYVYGEHI